MSHPQLTNGSSLIPARVCMQGVASFVQAPLTKAEKGLPKGISRLVSLCSNSSLSWEDKQMGGKQFGTVIAHSNRDSNGFGTYLMRKITKNRGLFLVKKSTVARCVA